MEKKEYSSVLLPRSETVKKENASSLEMNAVLCNHFLWVYNVYTAEFLWINAFFGKGILSRSQPTVMFQQFSQFNDNCTNKSIRYTRPKLKLFSSLLDKSEAHSNSSCEKEPLTSASMCSTEVLQLSFYEACWISHMLSLLTITTQKQQILSKEESWSHFCLQSDSRNGPLKTILPDNPFIVKYAAYHYYRSKGWVVRDGLNYGVDFVLYQKGPVFGHSNYAVIIIPYQKHQSHCLDSSSLSTLDLQSYVRICSRVKKTAIFCHVIIPEDVTAASLLSPHCISSYKIYEVPVKRWMPEKTRS